MKIQSLRKSKSHRRLIIVLIVIVVCLISAFLVLELTGVTHFFNQQNNGASVQNKNNSTKNSANGGTTSSKDNNEATPPNLDSSVTPLSPEGTFVSNHSPNLSGKPAPSTESSTCTTTPGAKCTIRFTSGNIAKSLGSKTTDSDGNVSWNWTLEGVGLTKGKWTVTALATNGDKTSKTTDSMLLSVEP